MMAKFFPRTHNMGIKRSVYDEVGGFGDLRHGQDIELSNRIRKSGARIKFLINAVVYHRRRTSLKQFFKDITTPRIPWSPISKLVPSPRMKRGCEPLCFKIV